MQTKDILSKCRRQTASLNAGQTKQNEYRKQNEETGMAKCNSIKEENYKNVRQKQLGRTFQTPISYSYSEGQQDALFLRFI
jgi:hypothetical protein